MEIDNASPRYGSASTPPTLADGQDAMLSGSPSRSNERPFQLLMAGFEALDLLNIGLVVSNASGQMLLANGTAEQILDSRDGLALSGRGILRASGASGSALLELIRVATNREPSKSGTGDSILAVQRASGKRPLTLLVRSIAPEAQKDGASTPSCLVFIMDPEFPVQTAEVELRQLYGLTATEASLANHLMEGKTLDDCCEILDIRRSTARTHLQHLFEKVGVQRQSELVSLLLKSVGLVRARMPRGRGNGAVRQTV